MSLGSGMQIRYMHKLRMYKADFLKIGTFSRRFEQLRLKQIFWNFTEQAALDKFSVL